MTAGDGVSVEARELRFSFGENWRDFLPLIDEQRIRVAEASLRKLLGAESLTGLSLVDIGCGSGLLSLAARRLGARVVSFDADPHSVAATRALKARHRPDDTSWTIELGSILDETYRSKLGAFDLVYAWGVLHHTGSMWRAVDATLGLVNANGRVCLGLYNDQGWLSRAWRIVKRSYNLTPRLLRPLVVAAVGGVFEAQHLAWRARHLFRQRGGPRRGMSRWHDLVDWVGGYPFEVADPDDVVETLRRRGFAPEVVTTCKGEHWNNEFVFRRTRPADPEQDHPRQRITFVINSLECGGAERTVANLAAAFAGRGNDVTVVTVLDPSTDFFHLHDSVLRLSLGRREPSKGLVERISNRVRGMIRLRAALRRSRADVIVSLMTQMNVATLMASRGLGVPVVVSERTDPRSHEVGWLASTLRRWLYPLASAVVVQTEAVAGWARTIVKQERLHVIPNAISDDEPRDRQPGEIPMLLAVGRLHIQKGFDQLIDAFAIAGATRREWRLTIVGDGQERPALEQQAARAGLRDRIDFPGTSNDVAAWLERAEVFVLSSRFEGFPNALLEAMAAGLPVVSMNCPSGPAEMIRPEMDGLLVPAGDVPALAAAIGRLMDDPGLRRRLGEEAHRSTTRFQAHHILPLWEKVLSA